MKRIIILSTIAFVLFTGCSTFLKVGEYTTTDLDRESGDWIQSNLVKNGVFEYAKYYKKTDSWFEKEQYSYFGLTLVEKYYRYGHLILSENKVTGDKNSYIYTGMDKINFDTGLKIVGYTQILGDDQIGNGKSKLINMDPHTGKIDIKYFNIIKINGYCIIGYEAKTKKYFLYNGSWTEVGHKEKINFNSGELLAIENKDVGLEITCKSSLKLSGIDVQDFVVFFDSDTNRFGFYESKDENTKHQFQDDSFAYSEYKNDEIGISIKYPKNWLEKEKVMGSEVIFLRPKLENPMDILYPTGIENNGLATSNLNIVVEDVSTNQISFEEYTKNTLDHIKKIFPNISNIANGKTFLGSSKHEAFQTSYNYLMGNSNFKVLQIWTMKNNKAYVITYTRDGNDDKDPYADIVKNMIESFEIDG